MTLIALANNYGSEGQEFESSRVRQEKDRRRRKNENLKVL